MKKKKAKCGETVIKLGAPSDIAVRATNITYQLLII